MVRDAAPRREGEKPDNYQARCNLVRFRAETGVSQEALAELLDMSGSLYSKLESGARQLTAEHLRTLAKYFGRRMDDFYEADPPPPAKRPAPALMLKASIPPNTPAATVAEVERLRTETQAILDRRMAEILAADELKKKRR